MNTTMNCNRAPSKRADARQPDSRCREGAWARRAGPPTPSPGPGATGEGAIGETTQHRSPRRRGALGGSGGHGGGRTGAAGGSRGGLLVRHLALPCHPDRSGVLRRVCAQQAGGEGVPPRLCGATCPRRSRGAAQAQTGLRWGRQPRSEPRGSAQAGGKGRRQAPRSPDTHGRGGGLRGGAEDSVLGGAWGKAERGRAGASGDEGGPPRRRAGRDTREAQFHFGCPGLGRESGESVGVSTLENQRKREHGTFGFRTRRGDVSSKGGRREEQRKA